MTKGFITVATGNEYYYKLAYNLLTSYRYFAKNPLPFAIIADKENEYTKCFDNVIVVKDVQFTFMDKLLVFENMPYDEVIFLDADSLCYGDINVFWDLFKDATDFSSLGENFDLETEQEVDCWYKVEDVGKYGKGVNYRCRVHAGVMFFRKSKKLDKMCADCKDIIKNYNDYVFKESFKYSVDECSLAVAAAYNDMKMLTKDNNMFAFYPGCVKVVTDIFKGEVLYNTLWNKKINKGIFIHFGTPSTKTPIYRFSVQCLNYLLEYKDKKAPFIKYLLYQKKWKYPFMTFGFKVKRFFKMVFIKLKLIKK